MHPLGVNKVQISTFWKGSVPVTAFVPFFSESLGKTNAKLKKELVWMDEQTPSYKVT